MSREIKFRAWDKENEIMFEVFGFDPNHIYPWQRNTDTEIPIPPETCDCIIMQYTGLHDKNGKEIYESDIVKCIWSDSVGNPHSDIFKIKDMTDYEFMAKLNFANELEVIGNVCENADLL